MKILLIILTVVQFNIIFASPKVPKPQELDLVKYDLWNMYPAKSSKKTQLQITLKKRWSEELETAITLSEY